MLRRKLLLVHGSLVAMLLVTAITAILLLGGVLEELNRITIAALDDADRATRVGMTLRLIEADLARNHIGQRVELERLNAAVDLLHQQLEQLGAADDGQVTQVLPGFVQAIGALGRGQGTEKNLDATDRVFRGAALLREAVARIAQADRFRTDAERSKAISRLRWIAFGLGGGFMIVINISIFVLLRAAAMVVRPVEQLLEASRRLAQEDFDYRLEIERTDEFGELAQASNSLAAQLERNEQRKLETLHQVARTLNHELNNAISIIDLQLELVTRTSRTEVFDQSRLHAIHQALERMGATVSDLQRVRRIVLTDYIAGVKMLDLERSVEADPAPGESQPTSPP